MPPCTPREEARLEWNADLVRIIELLRDIDESCGVSAIDRPWRLFSFHHDIGNEYAGVDLVGLPADILDLMCISILGPLFPCPMIGACLSLPDIPIICSFFDDARFQQFISLRQRNHDSNQAFAPSLPSKFQPKTIIRNPSKQETLSRSISAATSMGTFP